MPAVTVQGLATLGKRKTNAYRIAQRAILCAIMAGIAHSASVIDHAMQREHSTEYGLALGLANLGTDQVGQKQPDLVTWSVTKLLCGKITCLLHKSNGSKCGISMEGNGKWPWQTSSKHRCSYLQRRMSNLTAQWNA